MLAFDRSSTLSPKKLKSLGLVVLLHVLLGWALLVFVGVVPTPIPRVVIAAQLLSDIVPDLPKPPTPTPTPAQPKQPTPPVTTVPVPEIVNTTPAPNAIQLPPAPPAPPSPISPLSPPVQAAAPAAPPSAPRAPVRMSAQIDGTRCAKPNYPAASVKLGEEGTVSLQFWVDEAGRVKEAKVTKGSGYARLDNAAREALSLCRFRPALADGKPVESLQALNYKWELDEN